MPKVDLKKYPFTPKGMGEWCSYHARGKEKKILAGSDSLAVWPPSRG